MVGQVDFGKIPCEELLQHLNDWAKGRLQAQVVGQNPVSLALENLRQHLEQEATTHLCGSVDLAVALCGTSKTFLDLVAHLRRVDEQTQKSSLAGAEMLRSVDSVISRTAVISQETEATRARMEEGHRKLQASVGQIEEIVVSTDQVQGRVDSLLQLSRQVARISNTIKQIANQTNLLALNATIEAARAGESGRGFAVVASEVKQLARQTAEATTEVEPIVERIQQETQAIARTSQESRSTVARGLDSVREVADVLAEVKTDFNRTATQVSQIGLILQEQSSASQQLSQSVEDIARLSRQAVGEVGRVVDVLDGIEHHLVGQLNAVASKDLPNKVIKLAQSDHALWKKRLHMMMMGRAQLNPDELSDHKMCRLGRWYQSTTDTRMVGHPAFVQLEQPHSLVHRHGIQMARHLRNREMAEAEREMHLVEQASSKVIDLLRELEMA